MVGLPDGEKNFEDMYNCLDTILACHREMDGQTSCHCIFRAMHRRRAVKIPQRFEKMQSKMQCMYPITGMGLHTKLQVTPVHYSIPYHVRPSRGQVNYITVLLDTS